MKKILSALALVACAAISARADVPPYQGVRLSTATGQADSSLSGRFSVAKSSITASTFTIVLDGPTGGVNASSATLKYGVKAASATISGTVTAGGIVAGASSFTGAVSVPGSSVTASAFFGDGSHVTGITGVPAGAVMAFNLGAATCPTGWVLCDGSNSTPDLRGIFIRGAGTNGSYTNANGAAFAATYGAEQNDQGQGHVHVNNATYITGGSAGQSGSVYFFQTGLNTGPPISDGTNGTPRSGVETRPANYALTYCQKQ